MAMDQAFFDKYKVQLNEIDALNHIARSAKKLVKLCEKVEEYSEELEELEVMIDDFKSAKS